MGKARNLWAGPLFARGSHADVISIPYHGRDSQKGFNRQGPNQEPGPGNAGHRKKLHATGRSYSKRQKNRNIGRTGKRLQRYKRRPIVNLPSAKKKYGRRPAQGGKREGLIKWDHEKAEKGQTQQPGTHRPKWKSVKNRQKNDNGGLHTTLPEKKGPQIVGKEKLPCEHEKERRRNLGKSFSNVFSRNVATHGGGMHKKKKTLGRGKKQPGSQGGDKRVAHKNHGYNNTV